VTGRVTYIQRSQVGVAALVLFYKQIRAAYPEAKVIYLVQDNWPVHKLPEALQAAAEQRLTPLFLPTYATWLNPIEKLWRWLKQEVLHQRFGCPAALCRPIARLICQSAKAVTTN